MQRRSFLGALLGLAAAPVLAKLEAVYVPPKQPPIILPTLEGQAYLMRVQAQGTNHTNGILDIENAVTGFRIMRQDGALLMEQSLHAMGGMMIWEARPGSEIIYTPEHPLCFDMGKQLDLDIVLMHEGHIIRERRQWNGLVRRDILS